MSDLTAKFATFEEQIADEHTAIMAALADMQAALDLVSSNTDLALENGAANTKALLAALGQTGACFPCPTPSIIVPPVDTTGVTINPEHCQRSQAIIATIHNILAAMDTLQSFNVVGSFNVINDAISEIIGAIAAGDTVPLPSFPEAVNIAGDYVSYAGERLFSGVGLIEQFSPLEASLVGAVSFATSAGASQTAYNSIIEGSGVSNGARLLFEAVPYSALWSYYFDPGSTPDLSGFDGGACGGSLSGITACTDFDAVLAAADGADWYAIQVPVAFPGVDNDFMIAGDYFGWTVELLSSGTGRAIRGRYVNLAGSNEAEFMLTFVGDTNEYLHHTQAIAIYTNDHDSGAEPFSVRICPPA